MDMDGFASVFGGREDIKQPDFEDVIKEIRNYLEKQPGPQAQALAEWMDKKHAMCGALVRQDVLENITNELYARRIPFLVASEGRGTGHSGILIRSCDRDKYNRMRDDVLSQMSYLVYTVPSDTLEEFIMSGSGDKKIATLKGLQPEDARMIIKKSREMMGDTVMAVDYMEDGTCSLAFNGENFMHPKEGKRLGGMDQLLLESVLNLHGFNKEKMEKAAERDTDFEEEFSALFPAATGDDPAWVLGDGNLYLKITDKGFEYGESRIMEDGNPSFEKIREARRSDRDFIYQLTNAISTIKDPVTTYDAHKAYDHLKGIRPLSISLTDREQHMLAGERELAYVIAKAYERKAVSEGTITSGDYGQQLEEFCMDASSLIKAAMAGEKVPYGYSDRTMDRIVSVCRDYRMKMDDYTSACRFLESIDVDMYRAQPEPGQIIHFDRIMENDGLTRSERIRLMEEIKQKAMEEGQNLDKKRYENQQAWKEEMPVKETE